jgi:hypothetical protein
MDLIGKYVVITIGLMYKVGQIVGQTNEDFYFVALSSHRCKTKVVHLYNINQMVQVDEQLIEMNSPEATAITWTFFDDEKAMKRYTRWLVTPPKEKKAGKEKKTATGNILSLVRRMPIVNVVNKPNETEPIEPNEPTKPESA